METRSAGTAFLDALDERAREISAACTRCGKCYQVCPMPKAGDAGAEDAGAVVGGVLDLIANGTGDARAERWARSCSSSGDCLSACDYGVNPRFMLALARLALQRKRQSASACRATGRKAFDAMSRGVRVLSRLQLSPGQLRRLGELPQGDEPRNPDIVFYTGCNVLKTPHIALLCLDVLDALGVSYRVMGGPAHCCGVLQLRAGDGGTSGRLAYSTIEGLAVCNTAEVLAWCPSCQVQLGEVALPTYARSAGGEPFDLVPFVVYLARRLDELRPKLVHAVPKRVALHEHAGVPGVTTAVRRILESVPELELVDLAQPQTGLMCATLGATPELKRGLHAQLLEAAEAAGVTTLAGIYHACHRDLCAHEAEWPFDVVNFMELVGAALGVSRPDLFKRLKLRQDVDAILADSRDRIERYELPLDEVRAVVARDLLGEQPLPLGRKASPAG